MSESKARAASEVVRLRAAIATIHDHLHNDRINEAHEVCECAEKGEDVAPPNILASDAASVHQFIGCFNELAKRHGLMACAVIFVPSKTKPNHVGVQLGGEVRACKMVENILGKSSSTYMGEHAA